MVGNRYPDDFFGFTRVPYHPHLGLRFTRPGPGQPGVVTLPASGDVTGPDREQSPAALYTVAEVGGALAVCDALLPHAADILEVMRPTMLTVHGELRCERPAVGAIHARACGLTDGDAAVKRLRRKRKARVTIDVELVDERDCVAARASFGFYVRFMEEQQLRALAEMGA